MVRSKLHVRIDLDFSRYIEPRGCILLMECKLKSFERNCITKSAQRYSNELREKIFLENL